MEPEEKLYADCRRLTNDELLRQLIALSAAERGGVVKILVRLHELDRRALVQELGYSSVYIFCRRKLRYGEALAYRRTKAAEACHRFPYLLRLIEEGELDVTIVAMLASHLTRENYRKMIKEAKGKPKRDVERLLAALGTPEPARETVSYVAVSNTGVPPTPLPALAALQSSFPLVATVPSSPANLEIRSKRIFTASEEVDRLIERARQVLWHKFPEGRFEDILREALLALLEARRCNPNARKPARPADPRSRRIPAWVRAEVDRRDGDRCAFVARNGLHCEETRGLEYDHIHPYALGGRSDDPANIRKLCPAHNQWRARRQFGPRPVGE